MVSLSCLTYQLHLSSQHRHVSYTDNVNATLLLKVYAESQQGDKNRMSTSRCAELMVIAVANRLSEVWISRQPVLLFTYFLHFLPSLTFRLVLCDVYSGTLCLGVWRIYPSNSSSFDHTLWTGVILTITLTELNQSEKQHCKTFSLWLSTVRVTVKITPVHSV